MKPRLFYSASPIVAAALAWSIHFAAARATSPPAGAPAPAAAEAEAAPAPAPAPPPAPKVAGSDWTWQYEPKGGIRVLCKGTVVLEIGHAYWAANWSWSPLKGELRTTPAGGSLKGSIENLKTDAEVVYRTPRPNVLEMTLRLDAAEAMAGIVGGGLQFTMRPNAAVLGGRAGKVEIASGGRGWSWEAAGMPLGATFEPAAAKVGPDGGVRAFLVADSIEPGTRTFRVTLTLPEGATHEPSAEERYDRADADRWFAGAMAWDSSPVDLRFLNAADRPAGGRGRVRAEGDRLTFGDGSPARFWGANVAAYAVFSSDRDAVPVQARRMAQLGFNMMRITHNDSDWVVPNVFGKKSPTTRRLDPDSMAKVDWWIKCMKDEGIYTWLDLNVGRHVLDDDGVTKGVDEIRRDGRKMHGYSYYNDEVQALMREFQHAYLEHVNPHTGLAYKDDPAIAAVLVTNENDLSSHTGIMFIPKGGRTVHSAQFMEGGREFARRNGLSEGDVWKAWEPGPAKYYMADVEHRFNDGLVSDVRRVGYKGLVATTSYWGEAGMSNLASLLDGDVVDVHSYALPEFLGTNPRYELNYISWIGAVQASGKPLTVTEWNSPYPTDDRFTAPLYTASISAYQGWDAPMLYTYSQSVFVKPGAPDTWSAYYDPALAGVMPAAALLYRRGQVAPARRNFHLAMTPDQFFGRSPRPLDSAALRTAVEQGRLTIGVPATPALPWLRPTPTPEGATVIKDLDRDLVPEGQDFVRSDTGELTRDWKRGVQVIDAPHCQAASGWIGGAPIATADARFECLTKKAVIALNSVDDQPLSKSRFVLITAVARAVADPRKKAPFASEPVAATITLKTEVPDLELLALAPDGRIAGRSKPKKVDGALKIDLPEAGGTHWYVLKAASAPAAKP